MGLTYLEIDIGNPASPETTEKVEFLIDSGAIYSVAPSEILEKLGIKPLSEERFILANGEIITRKKGGAVFKHKGKIGVADVVFGEPGDSALLGATTMEALGMALDPFKRELKPLPMMLA